MREAPTAARDHARRGGEEGHARSAQAVCRARPRSEDGAARKAPRRAAAAPGEVERRGGSACNRPPAGRDVLPLRMSVPSPYRPPEAPVADAEKPRGSPVKGMIFGLLVDIGGSFVASVVLFFVWAIWLGASGLEPEAIAQAMAEPDPVSAFSLISYAVGGGFSLLGGYVCARVARETEMRCAAVVATVSSLVSLAMGTGLPVALYLFLTVLTFAAVMFGGWMGQQHNARHA